MACDLLIKDGRVVDGSGRPSFHGDVAVKNGKILGTGKFSGPAARTIDAGGLVISPGIVDIHCHYDAQLTWDPLATFSCYHGSTTVVIGNCSLALAPVKRNARDIERVFEFLSYVEAVPMEVLRTVDVTWESTREYMDVIGRSLGINVGVLVGSSPLRYYVMGAESQERAATGDEIKVMQGAFRDAMAAGALGMSISTNKSHFDPHGVEIPAVWASEEELFAMGDVLTEFGTGVIQCGGGRDAEQKNSLMSRLSAASGAPVLWNNLRQSLRSPNQWKELMDIVDKTTAAGIRSYPLGNTNATVKHFTMRNSQLWRGSPTWRPILMGPDEEKMRAYRDPEFRRRLHEEVIEFNVEMPRRDFAKNWYDYVWVHEPVLEKNKGLKGKSIGQLAQEQNKGIIDAFLDLVVEENLDTSLQHLESSTDKEAVAHILNYPNTLHGQSDGGAHVQHSNEAAYATNILSHWVREEKALSLERAISRLTFEAASGFGIYDRGLLHPGKAADVMIFDPETIGPLPEDIAHDMPAGGWRTRQLAKGIKYTIVNGEVLLEDGKHTGALPGSVIRNSAYGVN
jgi:N-acyl-D-aspartate/D-glutamate deacylase